MSTAALNSLFGTLLIVAIVFIGLMAANQLAILMRASARASALRKRRTIDAMSKELNDEIERISLDVEHKFEFWWMSTGKEIVEGAPNLLKSVGVPFGVSDVPEQMEPMILMIKNQALKIVSKNACEFAVHLATLQAHQTFLEKVKRVDSGVAEDFARQYKEHLGEHRSDLTDLGIDVEKFEIEFSAA